jgi:hypothetical protein
MFLSLFCVNCSVCQHQVAGHAHTTQLPSVQLLCTSAIDQATASKGYTRTRNLIYVLVALSLSARYLRFVYAFTSLYIPINLLCCFSCFRPSFLFVHYPISLHFSNRHALWYNSIIESKIFSVFVTEICDPSTL